MPKISVVVPIYNVEQYLDACLESLARQRVDDLEVVMVNDGSKDNSPAIAEAWSAKDPRFKLITQPNGGLSAARNTGIDHATGEYIAFVDSDDVLDDAAYERLLGALEQTGSDFATGNVHRLTTAGTSQTRFLAKAFAETRLKTHVTKYRPLIADRTAWNKLFRRAFWDAHGYRFPEGVVNEDIPVILPAHFSARSVDVIADPIYFWRVRDAGELSITERRLERKALLDRISAVSTVSEYLAQHGPRGAKRWYDASLVADDLKYYVNVLDRADDEYRELFLDRVNALLDTLEGGIYKPLPAIERLKWHLIRRRMMPELLEVLRFQREDLDERAPVQVGRRWYGDYPFRNDPDKGIPESVYRLDQELWSNARIEHVGVRDGRLTIRGLAYVHGIGAPSEGFQSVAVTAVPPGRLRRVRLLLAPLRLKTRGVHRPDANAAVNHHHADVSWSGFEATLSPRQLRTAGRWRDATWEVYVTARVGMLRRRRVRFLIDDVLPPRAAELPAPSGVVARAVPTEDRRLELQVRTQWAALQEHRLDGDALELSGSLSAPDGAELKLELRGGDGSKTLRRPLTVDGGRFSARVPLERLRAAAGAAPAAQDDEGEDERDDEHDVAPSWELYVTGGGARRRITLPERTEEARWELPAGELVLVRTRQGEALLTLRAPHAVLDAARWTEAGILEISGAAPAGTAPDELVLVSAARGFQHAWPLEVADGRLTARLTPAAVDSLDGPHPLAEGRWLLCTRAAGAAPVQAVVTLALQDALPIASTAGHKTFELGLTAEDHALLVARIDLDASERGPYHQRRLRETAYAGRRSEPLLDTVVYTSFRGRQYSDSPRAIHEELVRRGSPLEHLWIVRDAAANVPATARVLREGSREAHEALARTRYFVANDHFPEWFRRREDQVCLQTWHGTPLKRLGFDVSKLRGSARRFEHHWDEQVLNWQHVVSPSRFATPILQRAYRLEGEMLETGYPRTDVLAADGLAERSRALRERLGIPEGVRTVLYAPTFRDQVRDRRGRYRLDLRLDLDRLRDALGPDTVLLFRKHHYIADAVPTTGDGFVRDVSTYPDGTELLLAADVLVTDYSSMTADFANTGRPMLFFTYDLDAYGDEIRGFYVDFEATVPGPLLRTTDELAEALRDPDAVRAAHAQRYDAFVAKFCELDDGGAAARVVDRVFTS